MKRLVLRPVGWPCALADCPPGLFVCDDVVGLKTEYGNTEAYCDSGERFCSKDLVQPCEALWEEEK